MNDARLVVSLAIASLLFAATASAQTITADEAMKQAVQHNPDLRAAANDLERADLLVVAEDGARVPLWTTDGGYRAGQTPRLSTTGTRLTTTQSMTVMSQLGYTFSPGTQVALWFEVGRSVRDTVELGDLGGAVDTTVGFEVAQPWLRGFGAQVVDAGRRQARAQQRAAVASQLSTANAVAAEVLNAYWSLWSAERALAIAEHSRDVTNQQLAAAQTRLDAGVVAPAELVGLRTELASAEIGVVEATTTVHRASLDLARAMGVPATTALRAAADAPPAVAIPTLEESVRLAAQQSPELVRLRASVDSAEIQSRVARNNALPRLDTTASVQAAGLGSDVGSALEDLSGFEAIVGFVGLRFELPLGNKARRAEAERAGLAVDNARIDVERAELEIASRLATLWADAESARQRLALAEQTAALAGENVDAQSARFQAGKSTTLEVTDAIARQREAEARVVDVRIALVRAQISIAQATGSLLPWEGRRAS